MCFLHFFMNVGILIPGITDTDENLQAIAGFLSSMGAEKAELLEYHPMLRENNRELGLRMPMAEPMDYLKSRSSLGFN